MPSEGSGDLGAPTPAPALLREWIRNENATSQRSTESEDYPFAKDFNIVPTAVVIICYGCIFILGLLGNSFISMAVLRRGSLQTKTNLLLLNVCLADTLVLLVCVPTAIIDAFPAPHRPSMEYAEFLCYASAFFETFSTVVAMFIVSFIVIRRFQAINDPLQFRHEAVNADIWKILALICALATTIALPNLTMAKVTHYPRHPASNQTVAMCEFVMESIWQRAYIIFLDSTFFTIPTCALFILSAVTVYKMHIAIRQNKEAVSALCSSSGEKPTPKRPTLRSHSTDCGGINSPRSAKLVTENKRDSAETEENVFLTPDMPRFRRNVTPVKLAHNASQQLLTASGQDELNCQRSSHCFGSISLNRHRSSPNLIRTSTAATIVEVQPPTPEHHDSGSTSPSKRVQRWLSDRHQKKPSIPRTTSATGHQHLIRSRIQVTKLLVSLMAINFVCHLPVRLFRLSLLLNYREIIRTVPPLALFCLVNVTRGLLLSHSAFSVIAYLATTTSFRRAFVGLCRDGPLHRENSMALVYRYAKPNGKTTPRGPTGADKNAIYQDLQTPRGRLRSDDVFLTPEANRRQGEMTRGRQSIDTNSVFIGPSSCSHQSPVFIMENRHAMNNTSRGTPASVDSSNDTLSAL